jgi:hypothetical protein
MPAVEGAVMGNASEFAQDIILTLVIVHNEKVIGRTERWRQTVGDAVRLSVEEGNDRERICRSHLIGESLPLN